MFRKNHLMLRMKMQVAPVNLKTSGAVTYFRRSQSQFEDLRKLQFLRKGNFIPFSCYSYSNKSTYKGKIPINILIHIIFLNFIYSKIFEFFQFLLLRTCNLSKDINCLSTSLVYPWCLHTARYIPGIQYQ